MVHSGKQNKLFTIVYASSDGGQTWTPTLETNHFTLSGDPSIAFGPSGEAYYVIMASKSPHSVLDFLKVYRSNDGGISWEAPASIPNTAFDYLDREWITVDTSDGEYKGRIYVHALGTTRSIEGDDTTGSLNLYRSEDGGKSFSGPVKRISTRNRYSFAPGNSTILSDGTYVVIFPEIKDIDKKDGPLKVKESKPYKSNAWLKVMMSKDGGESLSEAVTISDFYLDWKGPAAANSFVPYIAVDPGSSHFKDRLYAVWPDNRTGRLEIYFTYSSDKGKTWSYPKSINDDRTFNDNDPSKGPNDFMPVVAVNNEGIVGVMWYDRRDNPDNLGYWIRFTASLDGGDTFLPSVRVSEAPYARGKDSKWVLTESLGSGTHKGVLFFGLNLSMFYFSGGHTAGIAADAQGFFHPFWIDNRTGLAQVWTSSVRVHGTPTPHGSEKLARLDDISEMVVLKLENIHCDRTKNIVSVDSWLVNSSNEVFEEPIKMRIINLESDVGILKVVNSDNMQNGIGAIFDFTDYLSNNQLKPKEKSKVKKLIFRLEDVRPLWQNNKFRYGIIKVDAKVLGKLKKE
jgi:hypothetical protein